jgi:hypothetical protein
VSLKYELRTSLWTFDLGGVGVQFLFDPVMTRITGQTSRPIVPPEMLVTPSSRFHCSCAGLVKAPVARCAQRGAVSKFSPHHGLGLPFPPTRQPQRKIAVRGLSRNCTIMTDHLSITKEEIPRWFRTGELHRTAIGVACWVALVLVAYVLRVAGFME